MNFIQILIAVALSLNTSLCFQKKGENKKTLLVDGEVRFANIRQLTFSGENAEAYFSNDGKMLVFQSHDGDVECDQIYLMEIKTGKTRMFSGGEGRTTCGYFVYPECESIIYSSTHLGNKNCPPKPDYTKGYVWKIYKDYDVFCSGLNGGPLKQLTNSYGYDAEATVAHDGSKIIYTSMASGDLDLWTMSVTGTNKTQLTTRLGYDGGAFYNSTASKIVWRAYYPKTNKEISDYKLLLTQGSIRPMALQIWTMNSDGSNKQQVTSNNAANFGPYFFPNEDRIIFSSNLHSPGGRDFDLYAINSDGSMLERITFFNGFDGFPMFSPNGEYLVFSSNRNQKKTGDTNLFLAKWNYK